MGTGAFGNQSCWCIFNEVIVLVPTPETTLQQYADVWVRQIHRSVEPTTLTVYQRNLRIHILPALGGIKLKDLRRPQIKAWASLMKCATNTARLNLTIVSSILSAAVDDEILEANPVHGIGRRIGLGARDKGELIKAMTSEQLAALLDVLRPTALACQFLVYALTGLRLGEGIGIQRDDILERERVLHVRRQVRVDGLVVPPKTRRGTRFVDLAPEALTALKALAGATESPWVMSPDLGPDPGRALVTGRAFRERIRRALIKGLAQAKLPDHFTIHSFRHTFACLLLQRGEQPDYVQYQLGHGSIQETIDTYGSWVPKNSQRAVKGFAGLMSRQLALW